MKIEKLDDTPTERVAFKLRSARKVPNVSGCYILTSAYRDILYIGRAVNIHRRLLGHLDNKLKTNPTSCPPPRYFYYLSTDEIEKLEDKWLRIYQAKEGLLPPLNKIQASMPSI